MWRVGLYSILGGFVIWANSDSDNIAGHLWHQFTYGLSYSKVQMHTRPQDCDFWGAPVGIKECKYEPLVTAYNALGNVVPNPKSIFSRRKKTGNLVVTADGKDLCGGSQS